MSAVLDADVVSSAPVHVTARPIRVGVLGLGHVGQAVARLAPHATRLKDAGYSFRVINALVRDVDKPRRCVKPPRLTTNPSAFLRGHYDVVIEALNTIEPARSIIKRLLGRGIPVVTANKALVAAHAAELTALAERKSTSFRYEASALAGVPFLGAFAVRPLVSDVQQFTGVVNGTSNFIATKLEGGESFERALEEAQTFGLTEPDPVRDIDGLDAADKLTLLCSLFGWGTLPPHRLDVQGIRGLSSADFEIARSVNSTIRPVIHARRTPAGVSAFAAPAVVSRHNPLASLRGALSGIQLDGAFVSDLFFSGPGAGPDITAATLLDDAVEAIGRPGARSARYRSSTRVARLASAPLTKWLVRVTFPGLVPEANAVTQIFASHYLDVVDVSDVIDNCRWVQLSPISREALGAALARLGATHRVHLFPIRIL